MYTKNGRPLQVFGNIVYSKSGKPVGQINGNRVFGTSGEYVGTIDGDRLIYRSGESGTRGPSVSIGSICGTAMCNVCGLAIMGDEPNIPN